MTTWAQRAKVHFSQKGQNGTAETAERVCDFSQKGQNGTAETAERVCDFSQKGQNGTAETAESPLLAVLAVHSGRSYRKHDFQSQATSAANDPTVNADCHPDFSEKLKAASQALDEQIVANGCSLMLPPDPPTTTKQATTTLKVCPNLGIPTPPIAPPTPWHHIDANWRPLAQAYHLHHVNCKACQSASQGRGLHCGTGAALWTGYQEFFDQQIKSPKTPKTPS